MRKSDLMVLARSFDKAKFLHIIKHHGTGTLDDWVLEGLQDAELIDHKNNLTVAGEQLLTRMKNAGDYE